MEAVSVHTHISEKSENHVGGIPHPEFTTEELAKLNGTSETVWRERLEIIRNKDAYISDMDGVVYHANELLPGVKEFVEWCKTNNKKLLFLTNNSGPTPQELSHKMKRLGVDIPPEQFYTSGMATAEFLKAQKPEGGSVYVIGEPGLHLALYSAGFIMNETAPDYVVIGDSSVHNYEKITKAVNLVINGAKLIGTNPDVNGPGSAGTVMPATGAFVACIELASGKQAFYCGKPSSIMLRYAQKLLGSSRDKTCIIGDRLDTDILGGVYSFIDPVLVMTGVTTSSSDLDTVAYSPYLVLNGVREIPLAPQ
jgi:NagD protein